MLKQCVSAVGIVIIGLTYGHASTIAQSPSPIDGGQQSPPQSTDSDKYPATDLTPVLEFPIRDGRNVIWCASFQIAWNELRDNIIGDDIDIVDGPESVTLLNKRPATKEDLSPDACVALAGRTEDRIVARINEELRRTFEPPFPELKISQSDANAIIAYAFLRKALRFKEQFDSCKKPIRFQAGAESWDVACFGVDPSRPDSERSRAIRRQVSTVSTKNRSDLVVRLSTEGDRDEIILAKVTPRRSLSATVDEVLALIHEGRTFRVDLDVPIWIPKLSFDLETSFEELVGKFLRNSGWEKWFIDVAVQRVQFELDERGAILGSEVHIRAKSRSGLDRFVFDGPFLIILRQSNRERPYFAAWIGNEELLAQQR